MMKRKRSIRLASILMLGLIVSTSVPVNAATLKPAVGGTSALAEENQYDGIALRTAQGKKLTIPGGKGTLTSNAWRSTSATSSGNTYQWDYQVSAVYSGNKTVESIKTSWYGGASLRNSGSISLGVSNSGATVGASSSWQYITTPVKYWENTNGAKSSDYRSNLVVSPSRDYRSGTISLTNTARVKLKGDPKPYEVSAGV
ncbi:hypothetical protein HO831_01095 [Streptococcus suis]|uniref:Uncharacterized protein n=1 Tax=Streptococcus suis TaxID=1307 RepID=A0A822VF69_STRSU|nr:hypothetical protein [Streptococcus suis]HEL1075870.1 hypothetical protein [Streptococcus equi subsp. zooepidemicus]AGZ23051.1 hypothetical protein T15_0956 [Streptococcus suis T15]MBO8084284.1 hypothetical protein [Streptococcus suis]MCB2942684.1 hypothetical protein [Streptococcus suis]MCB2951690.1 hypothetical protein [Streptococcus suis]